MLVDWPAELQHDYYDEWWLARRGKESQKESHKESHDSQGESQVLVKAKQGIT